MRISVFTQYGPLNSKPIFDAFIHSLKEDGQEVIIDKEEN